MNGFRAAPKIARTQRKPGELSALPTRDQGISGYDWAAILLVPIFIPSKRSRRSNHWLIRSRPGGCAVDFTKRICSDWERLCGRAT